MILSNGGVPQVSVIVPIYRNWHKVPALLQALDQQTLEENKFEVILVNNDIGDDKAVSEMGCYRFRWLRLDCVQKGSYAARNVGVKHARARILAFTDSDCRPAPNWLRAGLEALERSRVYRLGGQVLVDASVQKRTWVQTYERFLAFPQKRYVNVDKTAVTANMFAYKKVFDVVGPFLCERQSGEDMDWGKRAFRRGFRIAYAPDAVVFHEPRTLREHLNKNERVFGAAIKNRGSMRLFGKWLRLILPPSATLFRLRLASGASWAEAGKAAVIVYLIKLNNAAFYLRKLTEGRSD